MDLVSVVNLQQHNIVCVKNVDSNLYSFIFFNTTKEVSTSKDSYMSMFWKY